jgi:hypothetical protein
MRTKGATPPSIIAGVRLPTAALPPPLAWLRCRRCQQAGVRQYTQSTSRSTTTTRPLSRRRGSGHVHALRSRRECIDLRIGPGHAHRARPRHVVTADRRLYGWLPLYVGLGIINILLHSCLTHFTPTRRHCQANGDIRALGLA